MTNLGEWGKDTSPMHSGEREAQAKLGREEQMEKIGRSVIRPYMPEQHREFFNQLPFVVAGSVDKDGWPWASILFGEPGFITTPTDRKLVFNAAPTHGDPLLENITKDAPIGLLGIELSNRRRNRMNGLIEIMEDGKFAVNVIQSFGNCPQYIQTRSTNFIRDPKIPYVATQEKFDTFDQPAINLIEHSDTFFVASHNNRDNTHDTGGVDVSHRGGQPGFVKIEGNSLTIPDFIGNFIFNTFGNFILNPKAGIIFVDFETGDLLMLTGTVEIIWDKTPEIEAFKGAERAWKFTLDHGIRLKDASPFRWSFDETSPNTLQTGNWTEAKTLLETEKLRKSWLPYPVNRIVDESETIRSFYLEPSSEYALFKHQPGQYLTIRIQPYDKDTPLIRTYTLSSAPSDPMYRLSIKRDGEVSKFLHNNIKPGDIIEGRAPLGDFVLNCEEKRPAVLIGAGVGITPMISMTRQAINEGISKRRIRPLTIIHSVRTVAERPFCNEFAKLVDEAKGKVNYISLVSQPEETAKEGIDYDKCGRITPQALQQYLAIDDYDFYLCGPNGFMQATYDMLRDLGVNDVRIFAEAFGPSALKRRIDTGLVSDTGHIAQEAENAIVTFTKAKFEQPWTPDQGTLLEFAESHGLTPASGCRSGGCGSCAIRLNSGKIVYRTQPKFDPEEGEVLICCAVPAADSEAIELDL